MKQLGNILFKYRSYTPLPFVFMMILFMEPTLISLLAGFVILILGESIRVWAVGYAGSETRTTSSVGGSNLVTQGPYSLVRNPLYWGNIMIYSGVGIMSNALFPYLLIIAFVYFIFQYYLIIINEEEYLKQTYKEEYFEYSKYVNRFFPFPKKLPEKNKSNLVFDFKKGFKSERRTLQAVAIITIIILIKFIFLK